MTPDYSLYVITASVPEYNRTHLDVAKEAIAGGATIIQFREKARGNREILPMVGQLRELAKKKKVPLIINDRVDIAVILEAEGAHVGQGDMPLFLSRQLFKSGKILGCSATNLREALEAEKSGADYLGVGPIFPTPSKEDTAAPIGVKKLAEICRQVTIPVVAIGGISLENVEEVIKVGADGVAVISAVANAKDMKKATEELLKKITKAKRAI